MSTCELNLALVMEGVAARHPHRVAAVHGDSSMPYGELADRCLRLARYLADHGLGCAVERPGLAGHERGQDLMAQLLHNGIPYVEGLFGAFRARVAPFNVNYRYTVGELRYLLADAAPRAIQYHATFAKVLSEALADYPGEVLLLQVEDGSGNDLLPGAVDYEAALASVPPMVTGTPPSPDDLYVLYTGGTTGQPKGVLWRQADIAVAALGLVEHGSGAEWPDLAGLLDAVRPAPARVMACAPFMHGAAQWTALRAVCEGNTLVIQSQVSRLDPADVWDTVARQEVNALSIVGDAFAGPLLDELEAHPRPLPRLRFVVSGGTALHVAHKQRFAAAVPGVSVLENVGSSESGMQGSQRSGRGAGEARVFEPDRSTVVVNEARTDILGPGHEGNGWLGRRGRTPLGYLGDPVKTAATFPVIAGMRISIPGDRARLRPDGQIELLGRDSTVINTGGEKVFAEEVEAVLKDHRDVRDALVCGRPSERWGAEVVAIIALEHGATLDETDILKLCTARLARYKAPKHILVVDEVMRTITGKPDYRWAALVASALSASVR